VIPTLMRLRPKLRLIDLPLALADSSTSAADRARYLSAEADIGHVLDSMGAGHAGLTVG
jgi:hypothetical protein